MQKLRKEDIALIKEIRTTSYGQLLQEIKDEDYKEKKWLIETIEFYQNMHKKKPSDILKDIIINLITDLEEVNQRIERIKKVL